MNRPILCGRAPNDSRRATVIALALAALILLPALTPSYVHAQQTPLDPKVIPQFVEPLPMPLRVDVTGTSPATPLVISMNEFQQKLLPNDFYTHLPPPFTAGTYLWCYKAAGWPQTFPGPTLEARVGVAAYIRYVNNLQKADGTPPFLQSLITVDQTLDWADPLGQHGSTSPYRGPVPAVAHLHGGEVPSAFDGGPLSWWTPGGTYKGPAYVTDTYTYPNRQQATTLWYHDHAMGATRLNVFAGLAGFYLLRDPAGEPAALPGGPADRPSDQYGNLYEREIVIQDRLFDTNGQLLFPAGGINPEHPYWLPEFFGNVIVVNGKSWPYLQVEPRRYRFRFLDGSNARMYELRLMDRQSKTAGPGFWQIGTDGGLLDAPVLLNDPLDNKAPRLFFAPGERADVIIDFSGWAGRTLTLVNSAKAPYPHGTTADPTTTGMIMQFRVGTAVTGGSDPSLNPGTTPSLRLHPIERLEDQPARRAIALHEVEGPGGPIEVLVNNASYVDPATEKLEVGDTEVWEIINTTADTHPMHFHLVQYQLLSRQSFNRSAYMKLYGPPEPESGPPLPYELLTAATGYKLGGNPDVTPFLQGSPRPADPNERGWKDTFRMNPGEVTRIAIRVAPQDAAARAGGPVEAGMNLFPFDPAATLGVTNDGFGFPGGPGYVWHCHIVDHEDNEMMRPLLITEPTLAARRATQSRLGGTAAPKVELGPTRPNPAATMATIEFALPASTAVELSIFDVNGRQITTLASGTFAAGSHAVTWDGRDRDGNPVARGIYFYRLRAGGVSQGRCLVWMH